MIGPRSRSWTSWILASSLLAVLPTVGARADENRFHSPTVGLELEKPDSWVYMRADQIEENRAQIRLDDEEFERLLRERASLPLVAIAKYPEPHESLNPTVQVGVRRAGDFASLKPVEILSGIVGQLQQAFADFEFVVPVSETEVSGLAGARFVATYTLQMEGGSFPVKSRIWLVPRGSALFMIGMAGAQEGEDMAEEEFDRVLASIVIEH